MTEPTDLSSPRWRHHLADPAEAPALQAGDLLFGYRESPLCQLMKLSANQQATHVAIAAELDGRLVAVEMTPTGPAFRELDAFQGAYEHSAYARLPATPACRARFATWAVDTLERDIEYAWDQITVAGFASLFHRLAPAERRQSVVRMAQRTVHRSAALTDPARVHCTGYVVDGFEQLCPSCRPVVPWPGMRCVRPGRRAPSICDVKAQVRPAATPTSRSSTRALAAPVDLWVGISWTFRVVREGDDVTVIVDHPTAMERTHTERRCQMNPNPNPNPNPRLAS